MTPTETPISPAFPFLCPVVGWNTPLANDWLVTVLCGSVRDTCFVLPSTDPERSVRGYLLNLTKSVLNFKHTGPLNWTELKIVNFLSNIKLKTVTVSYSSNSATFGNSSSSCYGRA